MKWVKVDRMGAAAARAVGAVRRGDAKGAGLAAGALAGWVLLGVAGLAALIAWKIAGIFFGALLDTILGKGSSGSSGSWDWDHSDGRIYGMTIDGNVEPIIDNGSGVRLGAHTYSPIVD